MTRRSSYPAEALYVGSNLDISILDRFCAWFTSARTRVTGDVFCLSDVKEVASLLVEVSGETIGVASIVLEDGDLGDGYGAAGRY